MKTALVAFSKTGAALALRLATQLAELGDETRAFAPSAHVLEGMSALEESVAEWAKRRFEDCDALVFVSACGIAVRAIAGSINIKMTDPAVLAIDEIGRFVIPVLSGHYGGANALAAQIAAFTGGIAAITTATDVHGLPAVDVWAKERDFAIENADAVKHVSAAVLERRAVGVAVTDEVLPAPFPVTLFLRPRRLILGVGCKRGVSHDALQAAVDEFLAVCGYSILSLRALASIDLKRDEPALIAFAKRQKLEFLCHSASALAQVPGNFTSSERVLREVGVDNVCERAAVLSAGGGALLCRKTVFAGGVTLALARG